MAQDIVIGGRLHSAATGNTVAGANEILDDAKGKKQNVINQEVDNEIGSDSDAGTIKGRIKDLETAVGSGGSVDERIAETKAEIIGDAAADYNTLGKVEDKIQETKSEILGDAASDYNTLGKVEDKIQAETSRAEAAEGALDNAKANKATTLEGYGIIDAYTKSETYTKTEVNGLVDTPHQNYVTVLTYAALTAIDPGSADTIYRVSNYDGSVPQVDVTKYSEYAWDGTQYVFLCVKSQIDEVFDISVYNNNATYADLAAALGTDGANVPQTLRRGGMSVKFVSSVDNKYVQYFLTKDKWSADTNDWEKTNLKEEIKDVSEKTVHNSDNIFSVLLQTAWRDTILELYVYPEYINSSMLPILMNIDSEREFTLWSDPNGSYWRCNNVINNKQNGEIIPIICTDSSYTGLSIGDIVGYVIFSDIQTYLTNRSAQSNQLNVNYTTSLLTNPGINDYLLVQKFPILLPDGSINGGKLMNDSVTIDKLEDTIIVYPKNILNPALLHDEAWINSGGGTTHVSSDYGYYDYIGVEPNTAYYLSGRNNEYLIDRDDCYIAFYDSNKDFLSSITAYNNNFTTPTNTAFVRISVRIDLLIDAMLEIGYARTDYEPYFVPKKYINPDVIVIPTGSIGQAELQNSSVSIDKLEDTIILVSKNLLNPDLLVISKWINENGGTSNVSDSYGYYDYIAITGGQAYHISNKFGLPLSDRDDCYIAFYDSNKNFISSISSYTTDFTTPQNASYVRISVVLYMKDEEMLEVGTTRTEYEPYFPPKKVIDPNIIKVPTGGVGTDELQDDAVTIGKLASNVSFAPAFKGFVAENNAMSVNTMLTTDLVYICKNTLFVANINGTIESIKCGIGYGADNEGSVEITATKLNTKIGGTVVEHEHGLILGERTVLSITRNIETVAVIRLFDDYGNSYVLNVDWETVVGRPFLLNNNSSATISAKINFMPRDITKDIWLFGDSYFSYNDARWLSYMIQWGFVDWLANARPGEDAVEALADLNVLLSTGKRPRYVVWCMGMNHGRDVDDAVNPTWLQYTNAFLTLCNNYNITPILSTTPSVPTEIHTKMNEYVRASGYRYIDFAKAVENGDNYYWKGWGTANQLLSNDEVHPSAKGAITLANQVLSDFPEISTDE